MKDKIISKDKIILIIGIVGFAVFITACVIIYNIYINNMSKKSELEKEQINNSVLENTQQNIIEPIENENIVNEQAVENNISDNKTTTTSQTDTKTTNKNNSKKQSTTQTNNNIAKTEESKNEQSAQVVQQNTGSATTQNQPDTQATQTQPQQPAEEKPQETAPTIEEQPVVKKKTLLYFGATWCGYCKLMEPSINEIASEMSSTVTVIKYDYDQNTDMANKYGVTALPTTIILEDGQVTNKLVGYRAKSVVVDALK